MRELITQRWSDLEPLIDALLDVAPANREAWLTEHCGDPDLRAAALELIGHDNDESPAMRIFDTLAPPESDSSDRQIGPYRLLEKLGEGGMAVVFLAERQTAGYRQRVALKLMRLGLYGHEEQALFQREQGIHSRLEHPNIARVLDSGIATTGVPYFAMELVEGPTITTWCDTHRLDITARLRLFLPVCDAVQFAHQNLIVHRDLKPSNILIGADGTPKLLDFGIAKLLHRADDEGQTQTAVQHLTPGYAAPEQFARGTITTATDVYALGVLLHELLTGARPQLLTDGTAQFPSARVQNLSNPNATAAATARATNRKMLARALRGDLDSLVSKALHTEPERRYPGALALAEDIRRHLAGQPIIARPDSLDYRAVKFCKRNRLAIFAAAIVAITLIVSSAYSFNQAVRERASATRAEAEAGRANAVKSFLLDVFIGAQPDSTTPIETAEDLLARGRQRVPLEFADRPGLEAEILATLGTIERARGHFPQARNALDAAVTLAQEKLGGGDARTLDIAVRDAALAESEGQFGAGRQRLSQALAAYRASHPGDSEEVAAALAQLAVLGTRLRDEHAIATAREALEMYRRLAPADASKLTEALTTLGDALQNLGRSEEAVVVMEEALHLRREKLGNNHIAVAENLATLAGALRNVGRLSESEQSLREAVAIERKGYAGPSQTLATSLNDLATTLSLEEKFDEAGNLLDETLQIQRQIYPADHPYLATTLANLGVVNSRQGRDRQAESLLREALSMDLRVRAPDHPLIALRRLNLAKALMAQKRFEEAQSELDQALAADRQRYGDHGERVASDLVVQATLQEKIGKPQQSIEYARTAIGYYQAVLPPGHGKIIEARLTLATSLDEVGDHAGARAECQTALADARASRPASRANAARALTCMGRAELGLAHRTEADAELREAVALWKQPPSANADQIDEVRRLLQPEQTTVSPTTH